MPFYRLGNTMMHVKFGGKLAKNPPAACCARIPSNAGGKPEVRCMAMSTLLCDWPVGGGTCDAPLCPEHGAEVGRDRHYCAAHMVLHRAAQPESF